MSDLAGKKKITKTSLIDVEVATVVNRNKINEVAMKKELEKQTTVSDSSTETDAKNSPDAESSVEIKETGAVKSSADKIKLNQRSHLSDESLGNMNPSSSTEKKNKFDPGAYRNKKSFFWEESDFNRKPKRRPERHSRTDKKDVIGKGKDTSIESTKVKTKGKLAKDSNIKKTSKPRQGKYVNYEKNINLRPGKYASYENSNTLRPKKYSSNEKSYKLRPLKFSGTEKTKKPRTGRYTDEEKPHKHRFARESSYEKWYDPRQNQQSTSVKNAKSKLVSDLSVERLIRDRYSSSKKRNTPQKFSKENSDKRKLGSESSHEKSKKRFKKGSRERHDLRTASYDMLSWTRPDVYSEVESKIKNPESVSDSSFENHPKPTRMDEGGSPEKKNNLGSGDSTDERNDNKLKANDHNVDKKLRQPASSASVEEEQTTRHPTTRWKPRNLGREKYIYKRKKALRSTKMSKYYEDKEDIDGPNGTGGEYIDPYLSPYSCKIDFEQAAMQIDGVDAAQVEVIGRSAGYNDIVMLKLSGSKKKGFRFRVDAREDKYLDEPPEKKIIFIVHGLSVYGMVNVESLSKMRVLKKLMGYYGKHLDKFDIYLIPLANPDGFTYAQQVNLWAKNRSPQALCPGVQVDRNFEVAWKDNLNINSCDQHYPGPTPFSEFESRAIRDVLHKYGQRIIAYINVHSSSEDHAIFKGDAVLYPKGYADSNEESDRYVDLQGEIEEMMRNASFRHLSVHVNTLKEWYGKVRGTSVDYASSVYGIPYALEFAMQPYPDNRHKAHAPKYSKLALEEIWQRVIDVVFNNINNNYQDQVGFKKL